MRRVLWPCQVVQIQALKTLEEPAHRGPGGGPTQLVGHGLLGRVQALAHAHFSESVDQQAQHHHEGQRHDPLRLLHKDRGGQEERIFEEGEAAFHRRLGFVGLDQLPIGSVATSRTLVAIRKAALRRTSRSRASGRVGAGPGPAIAARSAAPPGADVPPAHTWGRPRPWPAPPATAGAVDAPVPAPPGHPGRRRRGGGSRCHQRLSHLACSRAACRCSVARARCFPARDAPPASARGPAAAPASAPTTTAVPRPCCQVAGSSRTIACATADVSGTRLTQATSAC